MDKSKVDIKEHYNRIRKTPKERRNSKVVGIRYANNFIKAVLIRQYAKQDFSVLDFGCGKGGDLRKYGRR